MIIHCKIFFFFFLLVFKINSSILIYWIIVIPGCVDLRDDRDTDLFGNSEIIANHGRWWWLYVSSPQQFINLTQYSAVVFETGPLGFTIWWSNWSNWNDLNTNKMFNQITNVLWWTLLPFLNTHIHTVQIISAKYCMEGRGCLNFPSTDSHLLWMLLWQSAWRNKRYVWVPLSFSFQLFKVVSQSGIYFPLLCKNSFRVKEWAGSRMVSDWGQKKNTPCWVFEHCWSHIIKI